MKKENDLTFKEKIQNFWTKNFKNMSSIRQILLWYLIISLIGSLLLWAPFSQKDLDNKISFIDALFVSSSAFSDTGLSTVEISGTFNFFGQLVTLILLSVGGIGWFTIKIFIFTFILRRKTRYNDIRDSSSELGTVRKDETLGLIFSAIIISLFSSIVFGFIFSLIFYFTNLEGINNYGDALWTGLYHASTSINNSGLDIFSGNDSMMTLYGETAGINVFAEVSIEILTMILFIIGGIGFGVFYDVYSWMQSKKTGKAFGFSLITKFSVVVYFSVSIIGLSLVYLSEGISILNSSNDSFLAKDYSDEWFLNTSVAFRWWTVTFNTFSTRNAGFSSMDLINLQNTTKLIYSLMMFIGSGPGSTAGGLRTTTVGVLIVLMWGILRNKPKPIAFNKAIPDEIGKKATAILIASISLVIIDIFLISIVESANKDNNGVSLMDNVFLVFSAYGTTGLSTLSLENYHWFSKLILIILMFIGQMGMSTTLSQGRNKKGLIYQKQFVEEYVNLG